MIIYKITCGNYFYFGQTIGNIKTRWASHKCDFKAGRHGNKILQRCWDKYGEAEFKHEHIYTAENKELLDLVEEELIDKYKNNKFCANICTKANIAPSQKGIKKSDKWKQKMSGSGNGRARAVEVNGIVYPTIKDAGDAFGTRKENITRWLNGTRTAPNNFLGKYIDVSVKLPKTFLEAIPAAPMAPEGAVPSPSAADVANIEGGVETNASDAELLAQALR